MVTLGLDRSSVEIPAKITGEIAHRLIPAVGRLLKALHANRVEVERDIRVQSARLRRFFVQKLMHKSLFQDETTLRQIVLNIVIPNLKFRESDEERFEEDLHVHP